MPRNPSPEDRLAAAGAVQVPVIRQPAECTLYPFEFPDEMRMPKLAWLIRNLLPAYGTGFLYGPPGSMKTFLAIDLACRVANGMEVFGNTPASGVGVIYIAAEDPDGVRLRVEAWKRYHKVTDRFPLAVIPAAPHLGDPESMKRLVATVQKASDKMDAATGNPARLVIVDTLSRVSPGMRGNEDGDATAQVAALNTLAEAVSGCCLALHHPGKDRERGMRGSSVYQANGDFVFEMELQGGDKQTAVLTLRKLKNASAGKRHAVSLSMPLEVCTDADGNAVTSCVCLEADVPKAGMKKLPEGLEIMFLGIRGAMDQSGDRTRSPRLEYVSLSVSRPALNYHLVTRELLATGAPAQDNDPEARGPITSASRNRLQKALEKLRHRGLIDFDSGRVWLTHTGEHYEALSRTAHQAG